MNLIYGVIGFIVLVALFVFYLYNKLVTLKMRVKEAWSDIDVQLKRRNSLIPNLVNSVKGYMKHEKDILENITKLRSAIQQETNPAKLGELDNKMTSALGQLKIAVESYPELKANQNFMQLQEEIVSTEDKISYSRRFFNQNVLAFNTALQVFPNNIFASLFKFTSESFFGATEEERKDVKVDFS